MDILFCILIPYSLVSVIVHSILHQFNIWEKWKIVIKKKKDKKYLTKVDPIYRIEKTQYTSDMLVFKYELGWDRKETVQILLLLIPLPIEVLYFEYQSKGSYYACEQKEVIEFFNGRTLEEFYEQKQQQEDIKNLSKQEKTDYINKLNKVFDENYE